MLKGEEPLPGATPNRCFAGHQPGNDIRVPQPGERVYFGRVRAVLEDWFSRLSLEVRASFRGRLRDRDRWRSAFWELYLHESLLRCGFHLDYEPRPPGTARSPDFLVHGGNGSFYLETVSIMDPHVDQAAERRREQVTDELDKVESPNFFLWVDFESEESETPSVAKQRPKLEKWLRAKDPDEIGAQRDQPGMEPY